MSELMDQAVIGMPYEMAMESELARRQFYGRAQSILAEAQALREEVTALRARVVIAPGRIPSNGPKEEWYLTGWNACLDELARLNGKTVSEGLLRKLVVSFDNDMRPALAEAMDELSNLLGEGKEHE